MTFERLLVYFNNYEQSTTLCLMLRALSTVLFLACNIEYNKKLVKVYYAKKGFRPSEYAAKEFYLTLKKTTHF